MIIITGTLNESKTDELLYGAIKKIESKPPNDILGVIRILAQTLSPNNITFDILLAEESDDTMDIYLLPLKVNGYDARVAIRTYSNVIMFEPY